MRIEEFINTTENWEQILAAAPYFVKTTWDGNYFILKYNQLSSDFSNEIVKQCRGSIFYWNGVSAECVCRPFDKFFNVQEENADKIDWDSACVEEKVDGSLMKVWYHDGKWHLSTNGTIDAFKAQVNDYGLTFGDIFLRAARDPDLQHWCSTLVKAYTHLFELTSPETRVIIPYDDNIYYLASINTKTKEEKCLTVLGVNYPEEYSLSTLEECLAACEKMTRNEEGYVVVDKYNHRVKIKSKGWLEAHYMANNGVITRKRIIAMIQNESIDDFLALMPEYTDMVEDIKKELLYLETLLDTAYDKFKTYERAKIYGVMGAYPGFVTNYVFTRLNNAGSYSAHYYVMSKTTKQITDMIAQCFG